MLPLPTPGDLPNTGMEHTSLVSPALAGGFFITSARGEAPSSHCAVCAQSPRSCLTLCDQTDCSPPGSSVHGLLQARILEGVAMPSSRGNLPNPEIKLTSPTLQADSLLPSHQGSHYHTSKDCLYYVVQYLAHGSCFINVC